LAVAKQSKKNGLTLLGRSEAGLPASPAEARLETFPNPARRRYRIRFETADFTSLCPVTGQMDFAQVTIEYIPAKLCVESAPREAVVTAEFSARGGIALTVRAEHPDAK
jgi:NADPH-dependent 7-cyano-7-deazaguanine reductase QueF